jgi:hypothetical protein
VFVCGEHRGQQRDRDGRRNLHANSEREHEGAAGEEQLAAAGARPREEQRAQQEIAGDRVRRRLGREVHGLEPRGHHDRGQRSPGRAVQASHPVKGHPDRDEAQRREQRRDQHLMDGGRGLDEIQRFHERRQQRAA